MKKQGFSALLPSYEYIPDIEPHVFGGRVYLYGSHDKFDGQKFCENNYVVYSASVDDLSEWRFDGVSYVSTQDPGNSDGKQQLFAPDVARGTDGRYYLYYCLSATWKIGVAVSDSPQGSFEFLSYVKDSNGKEVGQRKGDTEPFDPAVLVDEDGRVWLYYGNGPMANFMKDKKKQKASVVVELSSDMITIKSEPKPLIPTLHTSKGTDFEGHEFFEASSIRKFNNIYYFIYSSINAHELVYAMSDKPDCDFKYCGVLTSNGDIRPEQNVKLSFNGKANQQIRNYIGNNHGSLLQVKGKYYVFGHRHTNRNMFSRSCYAEEILMRPDGTFEQAELTSCGLNAGPLDGKGSYEARIACHLYSKDGALFSVHPLIQNKKHPALTQDGPDREDDPNQHIANMRNGATAGFRYFNFDNAGKITAVIRGRGKGSFIVKDGENGTIVAEIPLQPTPKWSSFTSTLNIGNGKKSLYFTFCGRGTVDFLKFILE